MNKIIIYTKNLCPYCVSAKALLDKKNVSYEEITVDNQKILNELLEISGGAKTVPQIFISGKHIGGFDNLKELDEKGELDKILS